MIQPSQRIKTGLAIFSGILFGFSFPPMPTGILAAVAFVPFFILFESIEEYGEAVRYSYLTFLVFNVITLYWTGGFTHGRDWYMMVAGGLLVVAHPLFFLVPVIAWLFLRRQFGFKASLLVFPLIWVSFEFAHSLTDVAFPWLTLGNTQTYDLSLIQFASITGVYGVSFLLLCLNLMVYYLYAKLALGEWTSRSPRSLVCVFLIFSVYAVPKLYGSFILASGRQSQNQATGSFKVAIVQPNIDPFEKWAGRTESQVALLQQMTSEIAGQRVDLVLWPETALPFYVLAWNNELIFGQIKQQVDDLGVNLLTGVPDIIYYSGSDEAPKSSRKTEGGLRYDSFNSSVLLQPRSEQIQRYAKILLVPFAERVPFSEQLSFLNAVEWNFGLGGWGIGRDTTVFVCRSRDSSTVRFSNLICFESVYPGFTADFVRKGAQFLTVITNDSWWGNTSGAYQHKQLTALRAVENRRWIVVCGNGGISGVIDPFGRVLQSTELYTRQVMTVEVMPKEEMTFYTQHGDWFAETCIMVSIFLLAAGAGGKIYHTIRAKDYEVHRPSQ